MQDVSWDEIVGTHGSESNYPGSGTSTPNLKGQGDSSDKLPLIMPKHGIHRTILFAKHACMLVILG